MSDSSKTALNCKPERFVADGEWSICRFTARYAVPSGGKGVFSCAGNTDDPIVLETTSSNESYESLLSVRVPKNQKSFEVVLTLDSGEQAAAVLHLRSFASLGMKEFLVTRDAGATHLYHRWFMKQRADTRDLQKQKEDSRNDVLSFSIVVPLFQTPKAFLKEMVESVQAQSHARWQLVLVNAGLDTDAQAYLDGLDDARITVMSLLNNKGIADNTNAGISRATGDFVCFLDHGDKLEPDTLYWYTQAARNDGECDVLYCDEDSFDDDGKYRYPILKPDFSPEFLLSHNYITHFLAIRRSLLEQAGLSISEMDGAQDYDLTLRATEHARSVVHVSRVLYHWRMPTGFAIADSASKPYVQEAGRLAVQKHCERSGQNAAVEKTDTLYVYRVRNAIQGNPLVSIIIPNKDNAVVLRTCVDSVLGNATYQNYEIVVVENNSMQDETFAEYERLKRDARVHVVVRNEPFNYSSLINFGVAASRGDYLLLLNNDTAVITPDFIQEMLGWAQQPGVGVVGAKLLYRDGLIQHAGVAVGPWGEAVHVNQYLPDDCPGYCGRAMQTNNMTAVTGACQMIPRSVFEEARGYDSEFAVGFNDIDFCCRILQMEYRVVYAAYAKLYHDEFTSRGRDRDGEAKERFEREKALMHQRWPRYFQQGDPYMNANFDKNALYFNLPVGAAQIRNVFHKGTEQ